MKIVMIEMHKYQARGIFLGLSELAFRKDFEAFDRSDSFKVLVCTDGMVLGEFTVSKVIRIDWNRRTQKYENIRGLCRMAHLSEERFTEYGEKQSVYALPVYNLIPYKKPYTYLDFGLLAPPGNYRYVGEQTYQAVVGDAPEARKVVAA